MPARHTAVCIVRVVIQTRLGVRPVAGAAYGAATLHDGGTTNGELRREAPGSQRLDLVRAVVRQQAVLAEHQFREIPILRDRDVALSTRTRIHRGVQLAFGVAPVAREGVIHATEELAFVVLGVKIQCRVLALELREGRSEILGEVVRDLHQLASAVFLPEGGRIGAGVEDEAFARANVVDRALQFAVGSLGTPGEGSRLLALHADDEFVLVMRLQVDLGNGAWILLIAALDIARHRTVGAGVRAVGVGVRDRVETHRCAVGRDGVIGVIDGRAQRRVRAAHRDVVGQRQVIAAHVAEHLEAGVTLHVPAETDARCPVALLFDVGLAFTVVVGESVLAQAQAQQEVVGHMPAVFHVQGPLPDRGRTTVGIEILGDVITLRAQAATGSR